MKGRTVYLGEINDREAAALVADGLLEDVIVESGSDLPQGSICRAVVDRLVKGQGGVFLRLPNGERGFLRDKSGWKEGQSLLVQVSGASEPGKAIPVTRRLLFRGRYVIVTPGAPGINVSRRIRDPDLRQSLTNIGEKAGPELGLIFRSACAYANDEDISQELHDLLALSHAVLADHQGGPELLVSGVTPHEAAYLDWADPPPDDIENGLDYSVLDQVAQLLRPEVPLGQGAHMVIESTRALIAVDVNTGPDTSPAAALKANIAAARALPRQLRLRGLGGQVVVDFAPVSKRDRGTIEQVLRAAFKADGIETTLIGWTGLGLFELSRKRERPALGPLLDGWA